MDEIFVGACKYCGQTYRSEIPAQTQEEADFVATEHCKCGKAQYERRVREQIEDACARVNQLFGKECEGLGFLPISQERVEILHQMVGHLARGDVLSASMVIAGGGKAALSVNSKGKICVTRSVTRAYKLEE